MLKAQVRDAPETRAGGGSRRLCTSGPLRALVFWKLNAPIWTWTECRKKNNP